MCVCVCVCVCVYNTKGVKLEKGYVSEFQDYDLQENKLTVVSITRVLNSACKSEMFKLMKY